MTNLDSIFKSKDITLPTEVHLVKAMVFPVVMYGCESWTTPPHQKKQVLFCFCVLNIVFLKLHSASAPPENLIKMRPCSRRLSCLLRRKENLLTCPGHSLSTSEEPSARSLSCILQIPELTTKKIKNNQ